jgi:hypothetical protein
MRPFLFILSFLAMVASAFWAYRENYTTQAQLKDMAGLQDQIADLRDQIAMQKAEWAYLNRPTRLRDLAAMNFDRLGLMPMAAVQLGAASDVALPAAAPLLMTGTAQDGAGLTPVLVGAEGGQIP